MSGSNGGTLRFQLGVSGVPEVERSLSQVESRMNALAAANRRYESDLSLVTRAEEQGLITAERGVQIRGALRESFEAQSRAAQQGAVSLSGYAASLSATALAGVSLTAGLATLAAGATAVARSGDEMTAALGRIRGATGSIEAARDVYEQLYRISLQTGQSVLESAGQFSRFAIAAKEIGATNAQAVRLVETLQKAAIVGGASVSEAASAATQLAQALASGKLNGDELGSLLENMPNLAVLLARELGASVGELRKMGEEGKLTADRVFPALLRAGEEINAEYQKMPVTMSQAFDRLTVAAGGFAARLDQALGASQGIAKALQAAAGFVNAIQDRMPTPESEAQDRAAELQGRIRNLEGRLRELRPDGEQSLTATRRGAIQRGAQNAAAATAAAAAGADQAEEVAAELAQVRRELDSHYNKMSLTRLEAGEREREEFDQSTRQGADQRRRRSAAEIEALRSTLDSTVKIRGEYAERIETIRRAIAAGAIKEAEGESLIAAAAKARDEALKKSAGTIKEARNTELEFISDVVREQGKLLEGLDKEKVLALDRSEATRQGYADSLELIQREADLVGVSTEARERELALLRERQRLLREQIDPESDEGRARLAMAGQLSDATVALRAQRDALTEVGRIGERVFDRLGDSAVDAFLRGEKGALNLGNVTRGILASVATDLLRVTAFNPIRNALSGSSLPTLSSMGSAVSAAQGGGGNGLLSMASTGSSLWNAFGSSSISSGLDVWGASNLGSLGFTGPANAALPSTLGLGSAAELGAALPALPTSAAGLWNGGSALGGFSSFSNVLGIAGAALPGLMSGNYAQAGLGVGGAALGTMILPGVGTVLGGLAGNLLGGLFGNDPARPASSVQIGIDESGQLVVLGSRAKGMDAAQGIAQAQQSLGGLNTALSSRGLSLRGTGGAAVAQTHQGSDANLAAVDQAELTRVVLSSITGGSEAVMHVIAGEIAKGAAASLDQAFTDIDWVKSIYDPLTSAETPISAFAASLQEVEKAQEATVAQAERLGLATEGLNRHFAQAAADIVAARDRQYLSTGQGIYVRQRAAMGDQRGSQLLAFDLAAQQQREALANELRQQGAAGEAYTEQLRLLEDTLWWERKNIAEQGAEELLNVERSALQRLQQESGILAGFLDQQAVSGAGVSPQNAYLAAQQQYADALTAARGGGDLSAYVNAANTLLTANTSFNATGREAEAVRQMVLSETRSLGATLDLPGFSSNLEAGLSRVMVPATDAMTTLRDEVAALREEMRGMRLRLEA